MIPNPGRNTREHCAWDRGRRAYAAGLLLKNNPHKKNTPACAYWAKGWNAAEDAEAAR